MRSERDLRRIIVGFTELHHETATIGIQKAVNHMLFLDSESDKTGITRRIADSLTFYMRARVMIQ